MNAMSFAQSIERRVENIRQNQEMDRVNILVRLISELRTPLTRVKDEVCGKYLVKLQDMDKEHKMELNQLTSEWYEPPIVTNQVIMDRIRELKAISASDNMFAYHVYKLTSEVNNNDHISCTTEIKNTSTNNKLEAILETKKRNSFKHT